MNRYKYIQEYEKIREQQRILSNKEELSPEEIELYNNNERRLYELCNILYN